MPDNAGNVKTVYRALGLGGYTAGGTPTAVDIKDGRIVRIRPLHYDSKYSKEHIRPWRLKRNGKTYEPALKSLPMPVRLGQYGVRPVFFVDPLELTGYNIGSLIPGYALILALPPILRVSLAVGIPVNSL